MNREIAVPGGAGVYPLTGDIESQAGNSTVAVVGIQRIGVSSAPPANADSLVYLETTNTWVPTPLNCTIQINGVPVSDDPLVSVNVVKPILVNGS